VAAFSIAAGAVVAAGWRSVASERADVEREARAQLRARASEAAGLVAAAAARLQARALADPAAAVVRGDRFADPPEPRPLARLSDSQGRDPAGDQLLREAQRCEADPSRGEAALSFYAEAAAPRGGARDPAVERLALHRLAALLRRMGRDRDADAARDTFLERLDEASRDSAEAFFARLAAGRGDAALQRDLLARLGSDDESLALRMLREAGLDDPAAIEARREQVARLERLRPVLFQLPPGSGALEPSGGSLLDGGRLLVAWARAEAGEGGEQRVLEEPGPKLAAGVRLELDPALLPGFPPPEPARGAVSPPEIQERAALGPLLPGMVAVASREVASLDAEAARRVRLLRGGLALLLAGGAALLAFTLRAVRRESEAAAARAAFVARVSHDLRTPLSVIRMYAETLAQGRATRPEEVREFAAVAAREAERLTALVARVLDFSRATRPDRAPQRAPVDLRRLLEEVAGARVDALAAAGMRLELVVAGDRLQVSGDDEALRAACANLLDNAIGHAASGGRIEVTAARRGGEVVVEVADRGPGLPPGLEVRLFEPFVRGPQARPGGSGLGLALVREVALAHGGRVGAGNREGGGARFTLALPCAAAAGEGGAPPRGEQTGGVR